MAGSARSLESITAGFWIWVSDLSPNKMAVVDLAFKNLYQGNARGNVAVITALPALPIISAIGCVVEYSMATTIKTKLQAAADAATLAAVSANSPLVATAEAMTGNGAVSNGATYTQNFFH